MRVVLIIPLITPRIIAKIIPDIQLLISNPLTSCAVRRIIKNPIIALTRPNVKKLTGKVRSLKTDQTVALTRPRTIATIRAVIKPVIATQGVIYQANNIAIADIRRFIINHMMKKLIYKKSNILIVLQIRNCKRKNIAISGEISIVERCTTHNQHF